MLASGSKRNTRTCVFQLPGSRTKLLAPSQLTREREKKTIASPNNGASSFGIVALGTAEEKERGKNFSLDGKRNLYLPQSFILDTFVKRIMLKPMVVLRLGTWHREDFFLYQRLTHQLGYWKTVSVSLKCRSSFVETTCQGFRTVSLDWWALLDMGQWLNVALFTCGLFFPIKDNL